MGNVNSSKPSGPCAAGSCGRSFRCGSTGCVPLLSRYQFTHEIATGPSTLVYIAKNKRDRQEYCLRFTHRHHKDVLADRRVDTNNMYAIDARRVSHPNILQYVEIMQTEDLIASVTTYCPGGSLEDFVLEPSNNYTNANLSQFLARLAGLFRQILSACHYLHHDVKMVHGNIKLTNIFLKDTKRTIAVLGDLGRLSMVADGGAAPPSASIGDYVGTTIYVAPEVIMGGRPSSNSDIYAIGACVYVALDSRGPLGGTCNDDYLRCIEECVTDDHGRQILKLNDSRIQGPVVDFLDHTVDPDPTKRDSAHDLLCGQWFSSNQEDPSAISGVAADDATRLFVTSDDGRDPDFELAKVTAVTLMRRKPLRIIGCVAGLWPAKKRAQLIKGTLVELGLESIPVAVGEEKAIDQAGVSENEFAVPYLAGEDLLYSGSGPDLCKETLLRSPDKTVTFVLQSGPTDVWKCVELFPDLFMRKVSRVILRSEVQVENGMLRLSEDGQIVPEVSKAARLDRSHMCELFSLLQDMGIPMTVVTRFASYAAKLPFQVYRQLGNTRHPVARRLLTYSRESIQALWERCLYPPDDPRRKDVPERCDKAWFCKVFLGGQGMDKRAGDSIWELCQDFSSFAAVQMIAAVPALKATFFAPKTIEVRSKRGVRVTHEVLGLTEQDHGVLKPVELASYISDALLTGFTGTDHVRQNLLIVSDDGKDLDDELAKVLLCSLDARHLAMCKAFIASLHPAQTRARLAKGTLKLLGLNQIPVGIGSPMGGVNSNAYEFDVDYLANEDQVMPSGVDLFVDVMENAEDNLFTLVVLSGMRDAWELLNNHGDLFRRKVARVVIMGGVEVVGNTVVLKDGFLVPDTAANNAFDMEAAKNFYRELQRQCIPMTIVSRWAAYAAKLPLSLYDRMARTQHPVAARLQKAQQQSLQHLWKRANMPAGDNAREGLPARCDKEWFRQVFLGGKGEDRGGEDSIWDLATTFQPYDCIALLGALPGIRDRYLDPMVFTVAGLHGQAVHEVMGLNAIINGVRDPVALCRWLEEALLEGIMTDDALGARSNKKDQSRSTSLAPVEPHMHHLRAFAQKYANQTPKMKNGRVAVMKHLVSFSCEEGLL